jgi:CDP-diacylglycerol--glycerol-3-phosphate 3-phosphatidyltransferase
MIELSRIRGLVAHRFVQPAAQRLAKTGLTPNTLTVLGFLVSAAAGGLIATDYLLIGGLVVLFAGLFDLLDGALARAKGQATRFGALLDSTLDRLSEAALLFGLLVLYARQDSTQGILLSGAVLVGSLLVSYVRARAEGLGLKCEVGLFTRPERVIVLASALMLDQVLVALWIMAVLTYVTVAQRFLHVWQQTKGQP